MAARTTRATAAKRAAALKERTNVLQQPSNPQATPAPAAKNPAKTTVKRKPTADAGASDPVQLQDEKPLKSASADKKRKRAKPAEVKLDPDELPHGLGAARTRRSKNENIEKGGQDMIEVKRPKLEEVHVAVGVEKEPPAVVESTTPEDSKIVSGREGKKARRPAVPYGHRWGETPFPDCQRPTSEECRIVNELLTSLHGEKKAPDVIPPPSETFAGCGEAPAVLDALIRTRLSANTHGTNSGKAINAMVIKYGLIKEGPAIGSVNYERIRQTSADDLIETIKPGGNHVKKGESIKKILDMVYEENTARREALVNSEAARKPGFEKDNPVQKASEFSCANPNVLSLDHMRAMTYHEAFSAFLQYPGIALKTASCVCLYALRHGSFAVDTHVFRISGWLGWYPKGADVNKVFSHLEYKIPDEYKYSLHTLFVAHGKACVRCQAKTHERSPGWENGCVIDKFVQRVKNIEKKQLLKGQTTIKWKKSEKNKDDDGSDEADRSEYGE